MRFDTRALQAVAYVGTATYGPFNAIGTAFAVVNKVDGKAFQTFVTARHVIELIKGDKVFMRLNTPHGGAPRIVEGRKSDWIFHPDDDVDLACCPTVLRPDEFDLLHVDMHAPIFISQYALDEEAIGVGDEVSIVGLYVVRQGENRNLPIVRSGTIAAMPAEPIPTDYGTFSAYLVDTRSIGGLSGSPVYVQLPPYRVVGRELKPSMHSIYFLGVMVGHHRTSYPVDAVSVGHKAGKKRRVVNVPENTGIALVIPALEVNKLVNQPKIVKARMASLKKASEHPYVPDAAPEEPAPPATEVKSDDKHRERFTALLDEALGKPKRGD